MSRLVPSLRTRTVLLAAMFGFTTFFVSTAPAETPLPRPEALSPRPAQAMACADGPSFEGRLTASSSSTTAITRSTTGNVFGYLSNVVDDWSCTAWYRYDGLVWARNDGELDGNFDWGNLINSTSVACNWVIGSTDYLKANGTTDCPDSDAEYAMPIYLANTSDGTLLETVFHNDITPDQPGDFGFIHSDCETYYAAESIRYNRPFTPSDPETRPGNNCDPYVHESTNTDQDIVVDGTPPTLNFDWPDEAAAFTAIPSAFAGVVFDATDAVAGFDATHTWSLQRQKATWSGSVCGTFSADGAPTTGVTSANNQVASQGLADNTCYQWTLTATDTNGNVRPAITSGRVRTSVTGNLGRQQQHTFEDWDLGAGDTLSVNVGTGNVVLSHPVLSLPIRGSSVELTLTYNRHDPSNVGMGPGWRIDILRRLAINADQSVTFTAADGSRHTFTTPVVNGSLTTYTPPATLYASLVKDTTQTAHEFTLTYRDRSKDRFDISGSSGLLVREEDRFGNGVTLPASATPATITDTAGSRTINLGWTSGKLTSITDWVNVSGGVIQSGGAGNRVHRFFYDGAGALIGWAEPLNTSASCTAGVPSPASYVTCLKDLGSSLEVSKTQTVSVLDTAPNPDAIGSSSRVITTIVGFANADVTTVRDAEDVALGRAGTDLRHTDSYQTQVTRRGQAPWSHDTITRYKLVAGNDPYARNGIIVRRATIGPDTWLRTDTAWHASYPLEIASQTEDVGGLARTTSNTWAAGAIGPNLTRTVEPLNGTDARWTDYVYNSRDDVTETRVSRNGSTTERMITRTCYGTACGTGDTTSLAPIRAIDNYVNGTKGEANGHVEDVTVDYTVDAHGQRTAETRYIYKFGGALEYGRGITNAFEYDTYGNPIKEIVNRVDGLVGGGDDVSPSPTTNARTDLTTVHDYDTAGNRISTADPRLAIGPAPGLDDYVTRWTFDALGRRLTETTPTTPGVAISQKVSATTWDELGSARSERDFGDRVSATMFDRAGRATATYEDPDGALTVHAAVQTGATPVDPSGRVTLASDQRQLSSPTTLGQTRTEYDPLGRAVKVVEAWAPTPLPDESVTVTTYDALGRVTCVQVGWVSGACADPAGAGQSTVTAYDLGDRVVSLDDEFTCTTTTYEYRDLALQAIEGRTSGSPCTGAGTRTINQAIDGLGRMTSRAVAGGFVLEASTFDSAGRATKTWSTEAGGISRAVETAFNELDEPTLEWRYVDTLGTKSGQSWARSNRDPAGNETDRCSWTTDPGTTWCVRADLAVGISPVPVTAATSTFDARDNRISQYTPGLGLTTYDPTADYRVAGVYLPTAAGKERQTLYRYDGRHRLDRITEVLCAVSAITCQPGDVVSSRIVNEYGYDANDSRILVTEDSGTGPLTRHYCHDARDQLLTVRSAAGCSAGLLETYGYDGGGNRTAAPGRTFTYDDEGQLASCTGTPACSPTFDADGRLTRITALAHGTWSYLYDAEGRLVSACQSSACTGSGFARLDLVYDGEGHRTRLIETPASGAATTTDFTYQGDRVVREVSTIPAVSTITRTFTTDESGAILKVAIGGDPVTLHNGTYLVTWNGHGDAVALSKVDATTGLLSPANRYTYSTWGTPTTQTVNGFADLRFRYLYVGEQDVQWDHSMLVPAGLLYMHARHYSPEFGRFLQPDPADAETNLYGYVENSPASRVDPSGEFRKLCMCGGLGGRLDPRKLKSLVDGILRFVGGGKAPSFNGPNVTAYGGAAAAKRAARILHRVLRQGVERYHVFDTKYGSGVTYYLKNGWKVTWRNGSKSGGPAIEIYAGTVRMKVHFRK